MDALRGEEGGALVGDRNIETTNPRRPVAKAN
jgi:hypothetical protein